MRTTRWLSMFLIAVFLVLALTGCFSGKKETGSNNPASARPEGGTLLFGRLADVSKLDPHYVTDIPSSQYLLGSIFEGLVGQDKDMNLQPLLATSWKALNDTTWEFKLRQGVAFHDGTPFNAQAVKINFDRFLDPQRKAPHARFYNFIQEVKIIDDYTVQFVLRYPFAPLPYTLGSYKAVIISPKEIANAGNGESKNPVGTGPFIFEKWLPGQEFRLVKNAKYWGPKPKVDKVVYKVVPEDATRLAMVETGELHLAQPLPVSLIPRVEASSAMKLYRNEAASVQWIGFNVKKKPLDDVRVRQAISYAIEKDAILKGIFQNVGKKAISTVSLKTFGFNPNVKVYQYDLNKAKALLAEAGYPNGFKVSLWTRNKKEEMNLAEVVQSQLKGVGITVEIVALETGAFMAAVQAGKHEMFIEQTVEEAGDADYNQYRKFYSKSFGIAGNRFFFSTPELDKLIEDGRKELDPKKRQEIYAKSQNIEMEAAVCIPIRIPEILVVMGKNVKGFEMNAVYSPILTDVTIK